MDATNALLAESAAALLLSGTVVSRADERAGVRTAAQSSCKGRNSCKGYNSCKGHNSCKGKNSCKGMR